MASRQTRLIFPLKLEDGWPPVAAESLPVAADGQGYEVLAPPLFIKKISVGDRIRTLRVDAGKVGDWEHLHRSNHSTVWLLRTGSADMAAWPPPLHALGCRTTTQEACGVCSVDVPPEVDVEQLDVCLDLLRKQGVAVAFPSWRRDED